jgi:predicted outer membrane protein
MARGKSDNSLPLEIPFHPVEHPCMSKVAQIEAELGSLSQAELREVRDWLDDVIEDELEFTPQFESAVQQSEAEMNQNLRPRTRQP